MLFFLDPAFVDQLRKADRAAIEHKAEDVLERVIADYGDVSYVNGQVATNETLAAVAERELAEIRNLSVGKTAPEIAGEDVDGKPMKLSEFRGKVVLLDFGSHEHCGGCKAGLPAAALDPRSAAGPAVRHPGDQQHRPTAKCSSRRSPSGEITWRCWWDGDKLDGPGPITTSWNIRGYPDVLPHRPPRRDSIHPSTRNYFDNAIETLLKEEPRPWPCATIESHRARFHRQSRKATLRIALAWASVFINTWCQPCSTMVSWSAWRTLPGRRRPRSAASAASPTPWRGGWR